MRFYELNLDGLVGQTHHYAGLAKGNIASTSNANSLSNPRDAALQGLAKIRFLASLGFKQGILPPHQRPNLKLLYELGFTGSPSMQLNKASQIPQLLSAAYSASPMWAANAATVSASIDSLDKRVQFTTANLVSNLHRHHEAPFSKILLERIFSNQGYFKHHPILPSSLVSSDEGAANHSRLYGNASEPGINFFVYGKSALANQRNQPHRYPARQTLEASEAIARKHGLTKQTYFACQNPKAIDGGVFHNDVIATANQSLLLVHEDAFLGQEKVLNDLQKMAHFELTIREVKRKDLNLQETVSTYLFNSQVLSLPNKEQEMLLLAPIECENSENTKAIIEEWINDSQNPINQVRYMDLKQSMRNGGGPACLRLRVPLNENELSAMHQAILATPALLTKLENWVKRHYRDKLSFDDLKDPFLIDEVQTALDELSQLLDLGSIYPFQCES